MMSSNAICFSFGRGARDLCATAFMLPIGRFTCPGIWACAFLRRQSLPRDGLRYGRAEIIYALIVPIFGDLACAYSDVSQKSSARHLSRTNTLHKERVLRQQRAR